MPTTALARGYRAAPSMREAAETSGHALKRGMQGESIEELQRELNASGANVDVDGKFAGATETAVKDYQRRLGVSPDGKAGMSTLVALFNDGQGSDSYDGKTRTSSPMNVRLSNTSNSPRNRTATFDRVRRRGQRNQLVEGRITINGETYTFKSGGGGRGSLPPGDYTVTPHLWRRSDRTMSVGGVGYSFALSDKYDPRVRATRTLLRIHPDGGSPGTIGCIGIVGNAGVQRRFREDMRAELQRAGGSFTLHVG